MDMPQQFIQYSTIFYLSVSLLKFYFWIHCSFQSLLFTTNNPLPNAYQSGVSNSGLHVYHAYSTFPSHLRRTIWVGSHLKTNNTVLHPDKRTRFFKWLGEASCFLLETMSSLITYLRCQMSGGVFIHSNN